MSWIFLDSTMGSSIKVMNESLDTWFVNSQGGTFLLLPGGSVSSASVSSRVLARSSKECHPILTLVVSDLLTSLTYEERSPSENLLAFQDRSSEKWALHSSWLKPTKGKFETEMNIDLAAAIRKSIEHHQQLDPCNVGVSRDGVAKPRSFRCFPEL